jgi:galactose oxidase
MRRRIVVSATVGLPLAMAAVLLIHGCSDSSSPLAPELPETATDLTSASGLTPPANASTMGVWSAPFPWPNVAVHLALLPNGTVISFGRTAGGVPQLWDPGTGIFTGIPSPSLLFCAGHTMLSNGRLFVAGGHIQDGLGLPNANIFDHTSNTWSPRAPMAKGRWYPTAVTMGNGEVVVTGGTDQNGATVLIPEVWKTTGGWRTLSTASMWLPYYPRAFLAPNGRMFYAGEMQQTSYLNPTGTGSWSFVANRVVAGRDYGSAVMYLPGKILYVGGGNPPTASAEIIDLNQPSPSWRLTNPMAVPRRMTNATILPTGDVLVMGGTSASGFSNPAGAVFTAELWNPATESWTTLASNSIARLYHGTAVLLPDARIALTGSGDGAGNPNELNAEIFSPPYLFLGPRPTITSSPVSVSYGQTFTVGTPDAANIAKVTWVRLMSTTHAFDMNQRFVNLNFTKLATSLSVKAPLNRNRVPPGHYMEFIIDGTGVPSVARVVQIK